MKCEHDITITPIGDDGRYEMVKCSKCGVEKRRMAAVTAGSVIYGTPDGVAEAVAAAMEPVASGAPNPPHGDA